MRASFSQEELHRSQLASRGSRLRQLVFDPRTTLRSGATCPPTPAKSFRTELRSHNEWHPRPGAHPVDRRCVQRWKGQEQPALTWSTEHCLGDPWELPRRVPRNAG